MDDTNGFPINKSYNLYKEELKTKKLSPATIIAYTTDVKQLCQFLEKEKLSNLPQITTQHLADFKKKLQQKKYSTVSLARKFNAFRNFFAFCRRKNLINHNPSLKLTSPRYEKSIPRILTRMEYRALRDTCRDNPRTYALIEIFLQTGMKVNEVSCLKIDDVKKDKITITSGQKREIPLTDSAKKAITRYLKVRPKTDTERLFITKNGTPLLVRNMSTLLMRCFRETEIKKASLNALRHTWIFHQLSHGLSLQLVSVMAGHKRVSTTASYLPLIEKKKISFKTHLKEL